MNHPKISIITPTFNQAPFIEETIKSVLDQNYPNLEFIIIDGKSTDNTTVIIEKYKSYITHWVSEEDRGQSHAINKGLSKATGDILAYINSDDYYLPNAFMQVAKTYQNNPDAGLIHGICRYVNKQGYKTGNQFASITKLEEAIDLWNVWWQKRQFVQPEVFWTRKAFEKVGYFNEDLNYTMDYDYWLRILLNKGQVISIKKELACFRIYDTQKSAKSEQVSDELLGIVKQFLWSNQLNMPKEKIRKLRGNWLYQKKWMKVHDQYIAWRLPKFIRWLRLSIELIKHPEIKNSKFFKAKLDHWIR